MASSSSSSAVQQVMMSFWVIWNCWWSSSDQAGTARGMHEAMISRHIIFSNRRENSTLRSVRSVPTSTQALKHDSLGSLTYGRLTESTWWWGGSASRGSSRSRLQG